MRKKRNNTFRTSEVAFLVIITCVLSFIMAMLIVKEKKVKVENVINDENINQFVKEYENIINNYYNGIDKDKLIDSAIKGMIESLDDPYAEYFDSNSTKNFNIKLTGYYEGLGIEIVKLNDNKVYVLSVFDDSNAQKAGLKVGDIILSIDGKSMDDMTTEEFANIVQDKEKVKILVQRDDDTFELELTKSLITLKSVQYQMVDSDKKIGYIKVDLFAVNTYDQFQNALQELEKENMKSLIVDLRENTGGHLSSVENIVSLFLNNDKVIYQIKKKDKIEKFYSKGDKNKKYNIVVIVDNNSASASELMTAVLKEQLNATVIGKTTYGKGTAQELITLSSGEQYKFTTKEWLTPNGNSINGVGITPDIECENDECMNKALEILK